SEQVEEHGLGVFLHILKILSPLRSIQKPGIEASRLVYLEAGCLAVALLQGCGIRRSRRFRSRRLVANHLRRAKANEASPQTDEMETEWLRSCLRVGMLKASPN